MITALPQDVLQEKWLLWKAGLYVLKVTPLWECSFQTSGLAYDSIPSLRLSLRSPIDFIRSPIGFIQESYDGA